MRGQRPVLLVVACVVGFACLWHGALAQETGKVYHDTRLGLRLSYPATLHLTTEAVLLRALFHEGVKGTAPSPSPGPVGPSSSPAPGAEVEDPMGVRFVLSVKPFGSPGLNPNLLLLTRSLRGIPVHGTEELARLTLEDLRARMPSLEVKEALRPTCVAGRVFYTTALLVPDASGARVLQRHYIHASQARQQVFFFTVTLPADAPAAEAEVFEQVMQGLRFDFPPDVPSPSPSR